ncbi:rCG36934 [Rattus norvegicus]|uniref:RCG36934 n=1 Tax=Rattus norvegicus TaxID=10116 RepID=A6HU49_RAT|nr:rCG36934 [Rattus norvegicus]
MFLYVPTSSFYFPFLFLTKSKKGSSPNK